MSGVIGWGVYGAGAIAGRFASDLARVPGGRLVAAASRSSATALAFAKVYNTAAVDHFDALLRHDLVDIVYVATPNANHVEAALACIEAGKSVLIEKPIATSSKGAQLIADAARAQGVFCMEAMWMRFTPGVLKAKALIAGGRIGAPHHLSANLHYPRALDEGAPLRAEPALVPCSLDLGVYPISLAISLFGPPSSVSGVFIEEKAGMDTQAAFSLGWDRQTAALSCGFFAEGDNRATIVGSTGVIELHRQFLSAPLLTVRRTDPTPLSRSDDRAITPLRPPRPSGLRQLLQPMDMRRKSFQWTPARGFGLCHEIEEVHACLRRGDRESAIAPLQDSILTLQIIEEAAHKARSAGKL